MQRLIIDEIVCRLLYKRVGCSGVGVALFVGLLKPNQTLKRLESILANRFLVLAAADACSETL